MIHRCVLIGIAISLVLLAFVFIHISGIGAYFQDSQTVLEWVRSFDTAGPVTVMALMAIAIVVSPLPSAPIALAAGAAYGHYWGTLYVVLGAETGAVIAFLIARLAGGLRVRKWFGDQLSASLIGSQWRLTALVFGLRLLPFVSFDIVSYAAGLTHLALWRFALATLFGLVPISFLLTHFGDALAGPEPQRIGIAVLGLGLLTAGSVVAARLYRTRKNRPDTTQDRP